MVILIKGLMTKLFLFFYFDFGQTPGNWISFPSIKFSDHKLTDIQDNWHYAEATIITPLDKWLIFFNKVTFCVQRHSTMFVQVYANPFIGEQIMNI